MKDETIRHICGRKNNYILQTAVVIVLTSYCLRYIISRLVFMKYLSTRCYDELCLSEMHMNTD